MNFQNVIFQQLLAAASVVPETGEHPFKQLCAARSAESPLPPQHSSTVAATAAPGRREPPLLRLLHFRVCVIQRIASAGRAFLA